jgi:hypothetical protein
VAAEQIADAQDKDVVLSDLATLLRGGRSGDLICTCYRDWD